MYIYIVSNVYMRNISVLHNSLLKRTLCHQLHSVPDMNCTLAAARLAVFLWGMSGKVDGGVVSLAVKLLIIVSK